MSASSLTIHLPEPVYERLEARARQSNRTVEAEASDVIAASVTDLNGWTSDVADAVAQLALLGDDDLRQAARHQFADGAAARISELHLQRQDDGLTEDESAELASLLRRYERAVLVRARAIQLLHERGHDVSALKQR